MVRRTLLFVLSLGALLPTPVTAQESGRVEVIEVKGIIDSSVERAVISTIEGAERDDAALVILQIDSKGALGRGQLARLGAVIRFAEVPVAAWIGPPGAEARQGAALLVYYAAIRAISPLSDFGPMETLDLRRRVDVTGGDVEEIDQSCFGARTCPKQGLVRAASIAELLAEVDGMRITAGPDLDREFRLETDPNEVSIRFHKLDLFGRLLHAAAQPSITYLLLLLALVGIVFELFHPSTGPAGIAGLAALALALYGIATLGASWLGFALIVAGVALFAVDLRFQSLGPLTALGFAGLVAGSLLLFRSPWLRVSPWVLGFGITGMVLFLVGAMTRVLRDLRAVASGALEVQDAHPHPNGQGD